MNLKNRILIPDFCVCLQKLANPQEHGKVILFSTERLVKTVVIDRVAKIKSTSVVSIVVFI